jgi:hypothetical protein
MLQGSFAKQPSPIVPKLWPNRQLELWNPSKLDQIVPLVTPFECLASPIGTHKTCRGLKLFNNQSQKIKVAPL